MRGSRSSDSRSAAPSMSAFTSVLMMLDDVVVML